MKEFRPFYVRAKRSYKSPFDVDYGYQVEEGKVYEVYSLYHGNINGNYNLIIDGKKYHHGFFREDYVKLNPLEALLYIAKERLKNGK